MRLIMAFVFSVMATVVCSSDVAFAVSMAAFFLGNEKSQA